MEASKSPLPDQRHHETVIDSGQGRLLSYLKELVQFRELLLFLVWRDMKVQFAQTSLGFGWMFVRPLLHVIAMTLIFGKLARFPSDGHPYPLFVMSGLIGWLYFVSAVNRASSSIQSNAAVLKKIYLPRTYFPLTPMLVGLVDLTVTLLIFLGLAGFWYGRVPGVGLLWLPVPVTLLLLTSTGVGFWLSTLTVNFPDFRQLIGNLLQLMMFATPVIWPLSLLPQRFAIGGAEFLQAYAFYPMVGVVQSFRVILLDGGPLPWDLLGPGFATATVLLLSGLFYFRRHERHFADLL